ncbi:MAG: prepilin-type N-terminal cleavage/methylation domain-containing protein [bacterium]|nr:prepilin-type N-terminal cleavage/methylation domain-containing protein [bacterium]
MVSNSHRPDAGFTLIEIAVAIGIIAILAGLVLVAINPARQFAQARNTQRMSHVNTMLNAIGQRVADNKGLFETGCAAGIIPTTATVMGNGASKYDVGPCLVPTYIPTLPFDPSASGAHYTNPTNYDSGYTIARDASSGRITISAPSAELSETISALR